jgi:hypothetical protein
MGEDWGATAYTGSAGPYGPARYNQPERFDGDFTMPDGDKNTTKIATIRRQIMSQHPEDISALADEWQNAYNLLASIKDQLFKQGDALDKEHWKSADAKKAFLRKGPGEALAYLDEWMTAANNNVAALRAMVTIATDSRREMDALWRDYQNAIDNAYNLDIGDTLEVGLSFWEPVDDSYNEEVLENIREAQKEYDRKARVLAYKYAQQYWDALSKASSGFGPPFAPMDAVLNPVGHPPFPSLPPNGVPDGVPKPPPPKPNVDPNQLRRDLLKSLQKPPTDLPTQPPTDSPASPPEGVPDPSTAPARVAPPPVLPGGLPGGVPGGVPGGAPARFSGRPGAPGGAPGGARSPFGRPSAPGSAFRNGVLGRGSGGAGMSSEPPAQLRNPSSPPHPPPGRGGRKIRDPQLARPPVGPAETEEAFTRPPSPVAPPVLNNRRPGQRRPGSQAELMPHGPGQPGTPAHPDAAPPVLNSPAKSAAQPPAPPPGRPARRGGQTPGRSAQQPPAGDDWIGLQEVRAEASSPVLDTPAPVSGSAVSGLEEVPKALRGKPSSPPAARSGAHPNTVAPELTARHTRPSTKDSTGPAPGAAAEEGQRIVTDEEAFTVQTPGGGVLGKRAEDSSYQAEPPTALGGH